MNFIDQLRLWIRATPDRWPLAVRGFFVLLIFVVCTAIAWYMFCMDRRPARPAEGRGGRTGSEKPVREQAQRAANLDAYKAQLGEMERSFGAMLRQLPGKTEVPQPNWSISRRPGPCGGAAREIVQPGSRQSKGFYAELPIRIRLVGSYHEFGTFVSGIAALPRM